MRPEPDIIASFAENFACRKRGGVAPNQTVSQIDVHNGQGLDLDLRPDKDEIEFDVNARTPSLRAGLALLFNRTSVNHSASSEFTMLPVVARFSPRARTRSARLIAPSRNKTSSALGSFRYLTDCEAALTASNISVSALVPSALSRLQPWRTKWTRSTSRWNPSSQEGANPMPFTTMSDVTTNNTAD